MWRLALHCVERLRFAIGVLGLEALTAVTSCNLPTTVLNPVAPEDVRQLFFFQASRSFSGYAGHGFLLRRPGESPLGLTAFHVAGPGPLSPTNPADPMEATAWLQSAVDDPVVIRLGSRLPIPGARTISSGDSQHDIAAFAVIDWDSTRALDLAVEMPAVGDTVWVLAVHFGDHPASGPRRHPARVVVSHDSALVYAYLASANSDGTSGAAVLDGDGRVVGVNVGTLIMSPDSWQRFRDRYQGCCGDVQGGEVVGLAVGLHSMKTHLGALAASTRRP